LANHNRRGGQAGEARRVVGIFFSTLALATVFSLLSDSVLRTSTVFLAVVVVIVIVLIGIISDIVGIATAAAEPAPLNAMAAKRTPGARQALRLVRNAPRAATIFNDLVGDICGTVSGAAGAAIIFHVSRTRPVFDPGLATVFLVSVIAAVTVGGKALGKSLAINRANDIVFRAGRVMWWLEKRLGLVFFRDPPAARRGSRRGGGRS